MEFSKNMEQKFEFIGSNIFFIARSNDISCKHEFIIQKINSTTRDIETGKLAVKIYPNKDQKINIFLFNDGSGQQITVEEFLTTQEVQI